MGVTADSLCFLCGNADEDQKHLFFECPYNLRCWQQCSTKFGMDRAPKCLHDIFQWILSKRITKFKKGVLSTFVMCVAYHIWSERNNDMWNSQIRCIDKVRNNILKHVYNRVNAVMPRDVSNRDHTWYTTLLAG
ncbi:uncharacterized protein [Spinacia oleracea]|uniref:Reverse transcriptase zinc-binding domain-containing protein n=1 Tax=Spinacia oleracea TaxID=3562 RepID=A0ABM3RNV2_SPIOL|nr:uncharacterized protein LOC130471285 [Spinacia oleracea]